MAIPVERLAVLKLPSGDNVRVSALASPSLSLQAGVWNGSSSGSGGVGSGGAQWLSASPADSYQLSLLRTGPADVLLYMVRGNDMARGPRRRAAVHGAWQ